MKIFRFLLKAATNEKSLNLHQEPNLCMMNIWILVKRHMVDENFVGF